MLARILAAFWGGFSLLNLDSKIPVVQLNKGIAFLHSLIIFKTYFIYISCNPCQHRADVSIYLRIIGIFMMC